MNLSDLTHSFEFVGPISVGRNEADQVDIKMPQSRYAKSDEYPVHRYGWGPFCDFSINTSDYMGSEGVYIFTAGYEIKYIGETVNIHDRIQAGYGNISPKNCFEGGQQTNCRINHLILETVRSGTQVSLWVEETQDRKSRETELIEQCKPPWNKASTRSPDVTTDQPVPQKLTSQSNKSTNTPDLENRFDFVGSASIELDTDGQVDIKHPQKRYSKSDEKDLHPDGEGPYCRFEIDTGMYEDTGGVFLINVGGTVNYVGRSSNIGKYIYDISNVTPSACYEGGQQTVCRINTKIFHAAREGREVTLWAAESKTPGQLKQELVEGFNPAWNFR